jgi:hypothetical protein
MRERREGLMTKGSLLTCALTVAATLALAAGAGASHDPSSAPLDEDFVTGTSTAGNQTLTVDAHSGPAGESPGARRRWTWAAACTPPP